MVRFDRVRALTSGHQRRLWPLWTVTPAVFFFLVLTSSPAAADWHLSPFLGAAFAGDTTYVDSERATGSTKRSYGGTVRLIGAGPIGIEFDFGYIPGFFQRNQDRGLVVSSRVITAMSAVVITTPVRWTGDSLRPYFSAGPGLIRARKDDWRDVFPIDSHLLGINLGAGAVGFLSEHTGLRWDLRYFQNVAGDRNRIGFGDTHLSFWRGTMGVVFRY